MTIRFFSALMTASLMTLLLAASATHARAGAAAESRVGFPQFPALSPDGDWLVFSWAGDLWITSSDGGAATRLTSHPASERRALFSPEGDRIAFESTRDGARDLYVMDLGMVDGAPVAGAIERVTSSDRSATLSGFTPDGEALLFTASRSPGIYRMTEMYRVSVDGGPVTQIINAYGREPRMSPDGSTVLFSRGYWRWERPAYRGPGSLDIWHYSTDDDEFKQLTSHAGNDGMAYPLDDGSVVFVSSRGGQNNVHRLSPNADDSRDRNVRALTDFMPEDTATIAHGVRDLHVSHDGETATFVVWDTIYTLDLTKRNPKAKAVDLYASADADELDFRRSDLDRQVSESAMSPDSKTIAVVARGEVYVRATAEDRPTRRITQTSARERDLAWSPDGATLYFVSDEPGQSVLRAANVSLARIDIEPEDEADGEEADAKDEEANEDDADSDTEDEPKSAKPGARKIAAADPASWPASEPEDDATEDSDDDAKDDDAEDKADDDDVAPGKRWEGALRFETRDVLSMDMDLRSPLPSPDGKKLLLTHGRGDLVVAHSDGSDAYVLLEHWDDIEPLWAPDSRHILYSKADLDFNTDIWLLDTEPTESGELAEATNITRHPDYDMAPALSADGSMLYFLSDRDGQNWQFDVYAVALDRKLDGLRPYELKEHLSDAAKAAKKRKPLPVKKGDSDKKKTADKKKTDPYAPDADDAYLRIRRVFDATGSAGNLAVTPGGDRVLFTTSIDGSSGLYSVDYRGRERKTVHRGSVSGVNLTLTGDKAVFVSGGQAHSVAPTGGKLTTYSIDAPVVIDIEGEQRQKFLEAARTLGAGFYHPTLKGLDWDALTERYLQLASQTRTNAGFNLVGNLMFGELDGSHLGMFGGTGGFRASGAETGYLGIDAEPAEGGYRVTAVLQGGPADREASRLHEGDVILAIDDLRLSDNEDDLPHLDLFTALADTRGRETLLEVRCVEDDSDEPKFVIITPTSFGFESDLRYQREVRHRRDAVHELSDGNLGYLHIEAMGAASVREFERDLYAAADGRDGLIIDVRDNGGGFTTDILLSSLTAPAHAYTIPRGADVSGVSALDYPRDRRLIYAYQRPITVLINENSFSNAEIFAHAIKTTGRGTLVGTQTYGGVISTGGMRLIDGTLVRMPFRGWFLTDGTDMENNGAMPDLDVPITPADEANGEDPQLEAAVDELLGRTKKFNRDLHEPEPLTALHPTIERLGMEHPLAAPSVRASADEPARERGNRGDRERRRGRAGSSNRAAETAPSSGGTARPDEISTPQQQDDTMNEHSLSTSDRGRPGPLARTAAVATVVAGSVAAAAEATENTAPDDGRPPQYGGMIRNPDVSAEQIVFVYANDLWLVPRDGGVAKPLASPPGREVAPRFSPDGKSVAFVGNYDGDRDIYRLDLASGALPERLTHHPANEDLCDWNEQGLLFFQNGLAGLARMDQIFTLSPDGGMPTKLPVPYGAWSSMHEDGEWLAYVMHDRDGRTWKRYRGGLAADIWLFNLNTKESRQATTFEGTDTQPMWHGDSLYYLSDAGESHRLNIWKYDLASGRSTQITQHDADDVKWPAMGPGANGRGEIVYQLGAEIRLLDLASARSQVVNIEIPGARPTIRPRVVDVSDFVSAASASPGGERVTVEARGDIWTAPAEHGTPINLSKSSGVGERNPSWSPCGRWIAYQSDQTGEHELFVRQSDGKDEPRQLTEGQRWFIEDIEWSPQSDQMAIVDQTGAITLVDVETGDRTKVDTNPDAWGTGLSWSHDGAWLAYSRGGDESWTTSIWLYNTESGASTQVTNDLFNDTHPRFDREGDYLYFATNRAFTEPAYEDVGSSFVYNRTDQLVVVPLREDVESPFAPEIDTVSWDDEDAKDDDDGEGKDEDAKDNGNGDDEDTDDDEAEEDAEPIKIDLAGFEARAEVIPVGRGSFQNIGVVDGGKLIFAHSPGMPGGGDAEIKIIDLSDDSNGDEPEAKTVLSGTGAFSVTADGKKLLVAKGGTFAFIDPAPDQDMSKAISTDGMEVTIDPRAEWRQIFRDAWRRHRDYFYDPGMHGVDWDAIGDRYESMLAFAVSRDDVSYIIGELISELNVGHAYYWGGDVEDQPSRSVGLLGADFELANGAYRVSSIYEGADWDLDARGPLSNKDIAVGDYVLEVNGTPVDASKDIWASFLGLAGKTISLTVNSTPEVNDDAREVVVEPIGNETALRYRAWVEGNRANVEAATSGRVGYIHVPDTGINGQNELFRQFYGQMHKPALIIDERWNGGGQVPTRFIELLNRPRVNYFARRHGKDTPWPPDSHQGPKAMLANGPAGSGGDAFPWFFKKMNLGPVIGTRTWGGLVGIGGVPPLIDGGYTAVPNWAFYETDGTWGVEGHGVDPDIEVIPDPAKMWNGGDPQIDAAIQYLERELERNPYRKPDRPAYPDRSGFGLPEADK